MVNKSCLALAFLLAATACSGEAVVIGADGLPLYVPNEYLSKNEHSWWVGHATGMDKDEGILLDFPVALLPHARDIPGVNARFIALVKAKAKNQEEFTKRNIADEYYNRQSLPASISSTPKAQRIHHSKNIETSSAWALFTNASANIAQHGSDLMSEQWLGECSNLPHAGVRCSANIYVGPFDIAIDGPEELMVRHAELESDLKVLFCSWIAKKGETREWCRKE